jgi:hypothetical protein
MNSPSVAAGPAFEFPDRTPVGLKKRIRRVQSLSLLPRAEQVEPEQAEPSQPSVASYVTGLLLLCFVVLMWVASSAVTQYTFANLEYKAPFFLTYVGTACFVMYLPLYFVKRVYQWYEPNLECACGCVCCVFRSLRVCVHSTSVCLHRDK